MSIVVMTSGARAEFTLNFQADPDNAIIGGSGSFATTHNNADNGSNPDSGMTRYLMAGFLQRPEIVEDANGDRYYHMIVGDLGTGFIQESYIRMGYGNYGSTALGEPADSASASGGVSVYDSVSTFGNGYDPLDMNKDSAAQAVTSGNGTGNPNRIIMRQIVSDGEVMMEFLKDAFDKKARISQMVQAPDITANFDLDMRNSTYSDATTTGVITNTMQLWGAGVPYDSSAFDMATDAPDALVNGGRYTYSDGSDFGGSDGTYNYSDGGFDHKDVDWKSYMDPLLDNPWSFEDSKL